ncbi:MFS general substrate transporter [Mycena floridula]|nr:MFS general substrate transporter [Mycena floridula]
MPDIEKQARCDSSASQPSSYDTSGSKTNNESKPDDEKSTTHSEKSTHSYATTTLSLTSTALGDFQFADAGFGAGDESGTRRFALGGYKAPLTVLGAFLALFCTFGMISAWGIFEGWYTAAGDSSRDQHRLPGMGQGTVSWIGSVQLCVFFASGGPIGRLYDRHGPRYLMLAGTMCYVTSLMLTSVCSRFWEYLMAQGVLFGLAVGLLFYPSLASVSTHFLEYRATALGFAASGSSVGGVMYPIVLQRLFNQVGFAWGVRITGFIGLALCLVSVACVTRLTRLKQMPVARFIDDSSDSSFFDWPRKIVCFPVTIYHWTLRTFSDPRYTLLALGSAFVALGLFVPFFYIVGFSRELGIGQPSVILAMMNAGGILGRIAPAYLSDRLGRFNLLVPCSFGAGILTVAVWFPLAGAEQPHLHPVLITYSIIYGFLSGAFISVMTPCICQISKLEEVGARIGVLYSVVSGPALVGGPIAGALLSIGRASTASNTAAYAAPILFSGLSVILGALLILGARWFVKRGWGKV